MRVREGLMLAGVVAAATGCGGGQQPAPERPAAAPWSEPAPLPRAAAPARPGVVALPRATVVALAPPRYRCEAATMPAARVRAATVDPRGRLARRFDLPPRTGALVAAGEGLAALTVTEQEHALYMCGARTALAVAVAPSPGAAFGAARTVSSGTEVVEAALVPAGDGSVAVAWIDRPAVPDAQAEGPVEQRLWLAVLGPDGPVGAPRLVDRAPAADELASLQSLALAAEPDGRGWLLAYARTSSAHREVVAEGVTPDGARRGRPQVLGPTSDATDLTAGVAPTGRAVVAWGAQDGGEERDRPFVVRAARREAGTGRFARAQVVDPGVRPVHTFQEPEGGPEVAFAYDGAATLAWTRARERPTLPLRVATAAPGRRFPAARTVARVAQLGGLAVRDDGAALLLWRERGVVRVARRPPRTAEFSAPVTAARGRVTTVSAAAFASGSGRPVIAWGARRIEMATETTDVRVQVGR